MSLVPCSFGGLCQEGRSLSGRGSLSVGVLCRGGALCEDWGGVLCQERPPLRWTSKRYASYWNAFFFKNQFIHSNWTTNTLCLGPQNISMLCIRWSYGWKILCDHKDVFIHIIIPCFALVSWTRSPIACQQMLILIPLRRNNWHLTCLNHIYCIIHVNVRSLSSC